MDLTFVLEETEMEEIHHNQKDLFVTAKLNFR